MEMLDTVIIIYNAMQMWTEWKVWHFVGCDPGLASSNGILICGTFAIDTNMKGKSEENLTSLCIIILGSLGKVWIESRFKSPTLIPAYIRLLLSPIQKITKLCHGDFAWYLKEFYDHFYWLLPLLKILIMINAILLWIFHTQA